MANKIRLVREAIRDILLATREFQTGTAYARRQVGVRPSFMVWYDGWNTPEEAHSTGIPKVTTHRFQIEIFVNIGSNEEDAQDRFGDLLEAVGDALAANPRLNGTCIRSRVSGGVTDIDSDGNNPMLVAVLTLEADRMNW